MIKWRLCTERIACIRRVRFVTGCFQEKLKTHLVMINFFYDLLFIICMPVCMTAVSTGAGWHCISPGLVSVDHRRAGR